MTTMPTPAHLEWIPRFLELPALLKARSHFLLGPRQTGKTALIRHSLPTAQVYDLLDTSIYLSLAHTPNRIAQELQPQTKLVVIDEIQRLPDLLNEVHHLIESRGIRFLLTGSSARKLRRGGFNLLGGRARVAHLHPLTSHELGDRFDLTRALNRGLLPSIYFSDDPQADLQAYAGLYLQQEVVAESATRNIPAFSRFLKVAAQCNATVVNFTGVANDAQVKRTTVYEYFHILQDTLILHEVPAWRKTIKRKPMASSKYYFFDIGVAGALLAGRSVLAPRNLERPLKPSSCTSSSVTATTPQGSPSVTGARSPGSRSISSLVTTRPSKSKPSPRYTPKISSHSRHWQRRPG